MRSLRSLDLLSSAIQEAASIQASLREKESRDSEKKASGSLGSTAPYYRKARPPEGRDRAEVVHR